MAHPCKKLKEVVTGFEPADKSFAGFRLTTWLHHHVK
jgi:hypothetical protein